MMEENGVRVSSDHSNPANSDSSQSRQRKKRKWDQPAEMLVSAGIAVPGAFQWGNMESLAGISLPGAPSVTGAFLTNPVVASSVTIPSVFPVPPVIQNPATAIPKVNQPKIQDELIIAREIVINDAESSVRYKLTKRQTQEEIQKCTGAVVITRGKYHPPNVPADGEKPLYLHISAAAHIKDTAERILAVDRAAAMIEEMLKQGPNYVPAPIAMSNGVKVLSTSVFLGFEPAPSLNIASRIRGPNDQYINHIMHETGATVVLRGRGSGNFEALNGGEGQQLLHLFLSANNSKSLEDGKRLAENLLDTISLECGATRVSSSKVYSAVPPPPQQSSMVPPVTAPGCTAVFPQATVSQSGGTVMCGQAQPRLVGYSQPLLPGGTSYDGYGGIYPQTTPLQQVALALRQSPSSLTSTVAHTVPEANCAPKPSTISLSEEKRPPQKRKFQELPVNTNGSAKTQQGSELLKQDDVGSELLKQGELTDVIGRNVSTKLAPKKLAQQESYGMVPPPPKNMPPPPKFASTPSTKLHDKNGSNKIKSDPLPDTLVKLMEYGEDDDDPEENDEGLDGNLNTAAVRKPFWAL